MDEGEVVVVVVGRLMETRLSCSVKVANAHGRRDTKGNEEGASETRARRNQSRALHHWTPVYLHLAFGSIMDASTM